MEELSRRIKLKIKKPAFWILLLIILVGSFLRLYKLGESSFWIDEGFTIVQSQAVGEHGYPLLNSGNIEFKDMFLPYLMAGVEKIFGSSSSLMRMIPAIFGIASIYLMFLLGRNLFNTNVGLLSSFFLSFSYWHIAWSRQARGYSLLVFFLLLSCYCIAKSEKTDKKKFIYWALISIVLATFAKTFGILIFIPFIVFLIYKKYYRNAVEIILIFSALLYFFRYLFINAFDLRLVNYLFFYVVGYLWKYFSIVFIASIIGFYLVFSKNFGIKKKMLGSHIFNLLCFLVPILFFSFFSYVNQKRYLFFVTFFVFLYATLPIFYVAKSFKRKLIMIAFYFVILGTVASQTFSFLPKEFYPLEFYTPQPNFNLAYQRIKDDSKGKDYYIISPYPYMDSIYLNKSDYYLPISYTGRKKDEDKSTREYYSGANRLVQKSKIEGLRKKGDVYVVFDEMASERVSSKFMEYIRGNSWFLFEDHSHQQVLVFKFDRM